MDAITKQLAEALRSSLDRMDRARAILTDGRPTPNCNWGVLETMLERTALAAYDIQPLQQARQPLSFDAAVDLIAYNRINAMTLLRAVEAAHGITGEQP